MYVLLYRQSSRVVFCSQTAMILLNWLTTTKHSHLLYSLLLILMMLLHALYMWTLFSYTSWLNFSLSLSLSVYITCTRRSAHSESPIYINIYIEHSSLGVLFLSTFQWWYMTVYDFKPAPLHVRNRMNTMKRWISYHTYKN